MPPATKRATPRTTYPWAIILVLTGVVALGAIIATRQTAVPQANLAGVEPQPAPIIPAEIRAESEIQPIVDSNESAPRPVAETRAVATAPTQRPKKVKTMPPPVPMAPEAKELLPSSTALPMAAAVPLIPAAPPESNAGVVVPAAPTASIAGCLELEDRTFRLKDTAGSDAPKSRSWKSGFLRKRPSSVEVVDAAAALGLSTYVGQRVQLTGTLVDRQMQVRSLQVIGAACN